MITKQQNEALSYFKENAQVWKTKANISGQNEVNIIRQRNEYVERVIKERNNAEFVLDVGCGTGDLVCDLAADGIDALGIDFSQEMIAIALDNVRRAGLIKAKFECCSVFEYDFKKDNFDAISANGFIEYISYEELDQFLDRSYYALKQGGSLVLGSRNRLFNVFSLNEFTEEEIREGNASSLLSEALQLVNCKGINDLIGLETVCSQRLEKEHTHTGIKVSTRYQYTPVQLVNMLNEKGFNTVELFPIHIHPTLPRFKDIYPEVHGNISNLLQNYARDNMSLLPQSSSFMLHAKKR